MLPWRNATLPARSDRSGRGARGEAAAARFLRRQGYRILVRNYTTRWGEIDLVCRHQDTLVFVEVKARATDAWSSPAAAVTPSKQRKLIRAGHAYLQELKRDDIPVRFDVVEVDLGDDGRMECRLIAHAFKVPNPGEFPG
ncbi:MAG: YraN family protein [Candidatus Methylacidiphilales bacterium]|nr:YraN family protein [Candidatus Methylacidiphilales bacterium]